MADAKVIPFDEDRPRRRAGAGRNVRGVAPPPGRGCRVVTR
ncbi:glycerol acyltransferase, partial [Streptomyces sp. NPDC127110]